MGIFHIFLTLTQTETQRHDRAPLIIWILKRNYFGPPRARRARPTATIPLPTTNITNYNTYLYVFVYYCGAFGPLLLYVDYVHNKLQVYTIRYGTVGTYLPAYIICWRRRRMIRITLSIMFFGILSLLIQIV